MAKQVNCPLCGKLADANLDNCPHCGGPMTDALLGTKKTAPKDSSTEACPNCGGTVREGDIICVRCGTNLLTGQKIADEQVESNENERGSQTRNIILALMVAIVVVAIGGAILLLQDPVQSARKLAAEGNVLEAIDVLTEFTEAHPERGDAQFLMGQLNMKVNRYKEAADAFDIAFDADPGNADAGRLAVVAASRFSIQDGGERQLGALERLVERQPDDEIAKKLMALTFGKNGDIGGLRSELEQSEANNPSDGATKQYLGLAQALSGNTEAAAAALEEAKELGVEEATAAQGLLASMEGNTSAGERQLVAALEKDAANPYAQARLGLLAMEKGDFTTASRAFSAANDATDIAPAVTFFKGVCFRELGMAPEALAAFEQLLISDSEFAADAAIQTAIIHMNAGEMSRAEDALRRASQFGATTAQYHTAMARLESMQGSLQKAQQTVRNATRVDSQYPAAHLESGLIYIRRGVLEDGIRELERYIELAGSDNPRGRVNEIEMLVDQLRSSLARTVRTPATEG